MALCSLSTGRILTPDFLAVSKTSSPAETSGSLLATAIADDPFIAAITGSSPAIPTTAAIVTSTGS